MSQKTIVCHSFPAWDTPYIKSTVELMMRLTKDHRVVLFDYHYTWKDVFKNPHAPAKRMLGFESRIRKLKTEAGTIEVVSSPPILPTNWIKNQPLLKLLIAINAIWLSFFIRRMKRKLRLNDFTLVNAFNPIYGLKTLGTWKAKKTVYYCYDEISGTQWSGKHGPAFEAAFMPLVDQVIATSSHLKAEKSKFNPNTALVPNGVNLEIFKDAPKQFGKNKKLGYVGAVDERIDFDLLQRLTEEFPDYTIEIYGPMKMLLPKLLVNRVRFHGAIPQELLPEKIAEMDLCLIPFIKSKLTKAIYPLKINEYLAMGKPVVTTDFADLSDFNKLTGIGKDHDEFITQIKKQLRYNNRIKAQNRIEFAAENSWEKRAESFAGLIAS